MLTQDEIRALNTARDILKKLSDRASDAAWTAPNKPTVDGPHPAGLGRTAEAADQANDSIFQALNVASNYGGQYVPEELLHNRKPEVAPAA